MANDWKHYVARYAEFYRQRYPWMYMTAQELDLLLLEIERMKREWLELKTRCLCLMARGRKDDGGDDGGDSGGTDSGGDSSDDSSLSGDGASNFNPDEPRIPAGQPGGGEWTSEGGENSDAESNSVPGSWGDPETFDDHFLRHGGDFNATSPEDYANQASDFYKQAQEEDLPMLEYPGGGKVAAYDPASNTFGVYNSDGTTATFYKPIEGNGYFQQLTDTQLSRGGNIINPMPNVSPGPEDSGGPRIGGGGAFDPFEKPGEIMHPGDKIPQE